MHLLVKNIHSSKSVWVRIERIVGFAEVSHYEEKQHLRIEMALACVFGSLDMHDSYQRLRLFCKVIACKSLSWG